MLNKTQINKILFYVYGVYLAEKNVPLFNDDKPKAWPYGPVFPRVNKKIVTDSLVSIQHELAVKFSQNKDALDLVVQAVNAMYDKTAVSLTAWSHQEGSPWYRTLYEDQEPGHQAPWNTEIKAEYIKEYFSDPNNRFN